jgi:hypothetical protein
LQVFIAPFKLGAKISKPKVSDIPPITEDWMTVNEIKEYYEVVEEKEENENN